MITGHLVAALRWTAEFRSGDHALLMGEEREDIRWRHAEEAETALGDTRAAASNPDAQQLDQIQWTGAWLLVSPSTVNRTKLGVPDWREPLFLCYGIETPDLMYHCNGYGAALSI